MNITGYILPQSAAQSILAAIATAFDARSIPQYWSPGMYQIYEGEHAGLYFLPADDAILTTPLMGSPVQTPQDFPEFPQILAALGGLDARVTIPASFIHATPALDE